MRSHRTAGWALVGALFLSGLLTLMPSAAGAAAGEWAWPVVGPVVRGYDPPNSTYGAGHRGIDIAVPAGTVVRAVADGTVTFAGPVGGNSFVTLGHPQGLSSTYSWVAAPLVRVGDKVTAGEPIALSGSGHPGDSVDSLHLGARLDGAYVDPMLFLAPLDIGSFIRLAPV
jgi:murein DD-endopeptidase MepM/ murein hydrolase activator NlpD